ncbi:haloacid dehalogenase type II [Pontibacter locisalis]|uniref:Haloacid dehalogenase type II n=1 Tax=Pontibacter locisalis TaxID=1719035 RepID=A0ABW5IQH6_9BACT
MQKPKLLIFDVNETLLDLSSMKESINKALDHEFAFSQWFAFMLQYSLVDTVTSNYHDFGTIGKAAMQMTQEKLSRSIPDSKVQELLSMIKSLPPHPDVKPGLEKLKDAGYRMITLTNSTHEVVTQQMKSAGLTGYFDELMSIESTRKYKPHPDTYQYALQKAGVKPGEAMLIAAHGWDITGALQAGLQAAFINREGQVLYPLATRPQFNEKMLTPITEKLTAL